MTATWDGRISWGMNRDEDGHRTYLLKSRVSTTSTSDGPRQVLDAGGLPSIGSMWTFGNDFDPWAFCYPDLKIERSGESYEGEPLKHWVTTQKWSTRPLRRCQDISIENPLLEPPGLSGSFVKYTKEARKDRNGQFILNSALGPILGLQRDANRPQVIVSQNVASLGLATFSNLIDTLNDSAMWGLATRSVKLSNVSWERKLYGVCNFYYTRRLEFDINFNTFDLDDVADAGFHRLNGAGERVVIKDANDENTPVPLMLDGAGAVNTDPVGSPVFLGPVELYDEGNLFALGIPTTL